jgi:Family of unknown function (DUF6502)
MSDDVKDNRQGILTAALTHLLRQLVRVLLRNGVAYGTFAELAKWTYVDLATREFNIKGRKQSASRVSVITGLSRKEVKNIRQHQRPEHQETANRYNRVSRVISAWRREAVFLDKNGNPAILSINGSGATFSRLSRQFSGDIPARAVLDEMVRVGAAKKLKDNRVVLLTPAYIPKDRLDDKIHILGTDVAHLLTTIDHNLHTDPMDHRFQSTICNGQLSNDVILAFRILSARKAQTLLEGLDKWLAQHDRGVTSSVKGTGRYIAGLGIYYFEESGTDSKNGLS